MKDNYSYKFPRRKLTAIIASFVIPTAATAHVPERYTKQQIRDALKDHNCWEWVRANQPAIQAVMEEAINAAQRTMDSKRLGDGRQNLWYGLYGLFSGAVWVPRLQERLGNIMFKTKLRVMPSTFGGWQVQVWRWWFPLWISELYANTEEEAVIRAEAYKRGLNNGRV